MPKRKVEIIEHSPEVQDVLGKVPPSILKVTLVILILIVVVVFVGSIVFRYPDKVSGCIKISSSTPTQVVVAQVAGYIDELVPLKGEKIQAGQIIASIQNSIDTQEAITLKNLVVNLDTAIFMNTIKPELLLKCLTFHPQNIGDLSDAYNRWITEVQRFLVFLEQDYYRNRIKLQKDLLELQSRKRNEAQRQDQIARDRYLIAKTQIRRDSTLHAKGVLSTEEYEVSKSRYKQVQSSIVDISQSIVAIQQGVIESKISLSELEKNYNDEELQHYRQLASYTTDLLEAISKWEKIYLLLSPIDGILSHWGNRYNHQYVQVGEPLFSIEPIKRCSPYGSMMVPPNKAGEIVVGQRVLIRLSNYPDEKFGFITGEVANISTLPDKDGNYQVEILLPKRLTTSYGKELPIEAELQGTAEIITTNYRLIDRFIMPIRKVISQNT